MALEIHAALKAAGIEIPFPQRDLHIRSIAPEAFSPAAQPNLAPNRPPATEMA